MSDPPTDDDEHEAGVEALHRHLAATAERPVAREASHYLGEAEAVVADLAAGAGGADASDVDDDVLRERLGHVDSLLAAVDDTEDDAADEHVAAARRITAALLAERADD